MALNPRTRARLLWLALGLLGLVAVVLWLQWGGAERGNAAVLGAHWGVPDLLCGTRGAAPAWALVGIASGLPAIAAMRRSRRTALVVLGCGLVIAILWLPGCSAARSIADDIGRFLGGGGGKGPANGPAGPGDGVSGMWDTVGGSLARVDWWLGLLASVSFLFGIYNLLRGLFPPDPQELVRGGLGIGLGVTFLIVNAVVAILLPVAFFGVAIATGLLALFLGYRLATGRGIGGHSLRCLVGHLRGTNPHKRKRKTTEVGQ